MKRLSAEQHVVIWALAILIAIIAFVVLNVLMVANSLMDLRLRVLTWPLIWLLTAIITLGLLVQGYRTMPRQHISFQPTGVLFNERAIPWTEIERVEGPSIFRAQLLTLKSGENLRFFLEDDPSALQRLGHRRLAQFNRSDDKLGTKFFWYGGVTIAIGALILLFVPDGRTGFGPVIFGAIIAGFGFLLNKTPRNPSTEPLDLEFLEPKVRYRDRKGRELQVVEKELTVTHDGVTKTFPAEPTRSLMGEKGEILHDHRNGRDRIRYARRDLTRLDEPNPIPSRNLK